MEEEGNEEYNHTIRKIGKWCHNIFINEIDIDEYMPEYKRGCLPNWELFINLCLNSLCS